MANPLKYEQLRAKGKEAAADFEAFARFVLNIKIAKHQRGWIRACQEIGDNPKAGLKKILIAPPGSGKTSLVGVGFPAWMIGRYPNEHVGLISYADKVAHSRSLAIRNLIEREKSYHLTFPNVEPDWSTWEKAQFIVKRQNTADPHPTLRAGGAMSAVVAYRLNGLLIDDAMDQKTSRTALMREKAFNNFETALETRLTTGAWQLIIGTRWSDDDYIGRLLDRKGEEYEPIHVPALDVNRQSYWPEMYPTAALALLEYNKPATFAVQYMGDTTGGKAGIIKRLVAHDEDVDHVYASKDLMVGIGVDTAMKDGQENDFTVLYVGGLDPGGKVWLLDRVKGHFGLPETMKAIKDLYRKWKPFTIWVEDAASGSPAVQTLEAELASLPLELVTPSSGGKVSRAHSLAPHIHAGRVIFPRKEDWFQEVRHILTHYPNVAHDDDLDALFYLVSNLLNTVHPAVLELRRDSAKFNVR